VNTPTLMATAPSRKSCCAELMPMPPALNVVNGETGTNTPMTLAMLLAPRL